MTAPRVDFYGANAVCYNSREPEVLNAGAAGTGKSLAWLWKLYTLADYHAGARCLIVRKTRESLTESVLVTFERDVLGPDHVMLVKNPTLRRVRQSYRHPNGSTIVVGGMDKPDKVLSSEWDFVYCPECTELDVVDWETLGGRLRSGVVPFQQIGGDCNPGSPHHFLYKRHQAKLLALYTSTHKDNPWMWDRGQNAWTPEGERYLARLGRMTGARRDRFLLGKWVAAEGVVYDFDPAVHQLPRGWRPPANWPTVWSIDWGSTSPTVLQLWAIDPDGRLYLFREVYQTRLRANRLGKWVKEEIAAGRENRPQAVVCDHELEAKADFEGASSVALTMADKADRGEGIEAMQGRFDLAEDGRPRIFFVEGARDHEADRSLVDSGRPTSTLEELPGYVWNPDFLKDEPIAENDHGADAMRYAGRWVDSHFAGLGGPHRYGERRGRRESIPT